MRSPRSGSWAKSSRRCRSAICEWCLSSAPNARRSRSGLASTFELAGELLGLARDRADQIVPGLDEGVGSLLLQARGQLLDADPGALELVQHLLGVAAVGRQRVRDLAMVLEGEQGLVGHRVDREWGGERLDVVHVRGLGVLGAGAGEEQPLGPGALVLQALHPP